MKERFTFYALLALLVLPMSLYAQTATLRGRVISAEDGTPLPGVNVAVKGTSRGTTTDGNGTYQMDVPNGQATLVFSFIGFIKQGCTLSISPTASTPKHRCIRLPVLILAVTIVVRSMTCRI